MRLSPLPCTIGIVLGLTLFAGSAAAEYPETAPVRPFNLSDLSGLTAVNLDVQYTSWTEPASSPLALNFTSLTFDLHADITLAPHWVVLLHVPVVYADVEAEPTDTSDCCGLGLGNFTLGVKGLVSSLHGDGLRSVLGGELSLSLGTAPDEGDDGAAAALAARARGPHDPGRYVPNTWTPRLLGHAQIYNRWFMAQLEAGLHFFVYDDDVVGDDADLGLRLALATGVRVTPELAIVAELNNMTVFSDDDSVDDETATSVDLGVRFAGETVVVGLRLYLPIDDRSRDADMLGFGVDLGARF